MIKFIKDILKDIIVTLISTAMVSTATFYGIKFLGTKLDITINPKITISIIGIIILIAIFNLLRISKRRKIDSLQELYYPFGIITNHDLEIITTFESEMYKTELRKINGRHHNAFENIEKEYKVLNVNGPLCPNCESTLKQKRLFWGKYKHFCPREHVSFSNKYTNHTMSEHFRTDMDKKLREKGIRKIIG